MTIHFPIPALPPDVLLAILQTDDAALAADVKAACATQFQAYLAQWLDAPTPRPSPNGRATPLTPDAAGVQALCKTLHLSPDRLGKRLTPVVSGVVVDEWRQGIADIPEAYRTQLVALAPGALP